MLYFLPGNLGEGSTILTEKTGFHSIGGNRRHNANGFFCRKTSRLFGVKMKNADVGRKRNHESENPGPHFSSFFCW